MIGDPTEIERANAKQTDYVGKLPEIGQLGFWLLTLATPFRGRALPCNFINYSSATLDSESTSRNIERQRLIAEMRATIGIRPVVLDREFSSLGLFKHLVASQMSFVIRLN